MNELTDSEIVRKIGDSLIGKIGSPSNPPETNELRAFHDVYLLDMEIGSGASFEQYFRWSSKEQIDRILDQLKKTGLQEIFSSTKKAIDIAFPDGVPEDPLAFDQCTDWTEEQDTAMSELYNQEINIHALIEVKLAVYAREKELLSMPRFQVLTKQSSGRLKALLRWPLRKPFSRN